MTDETQPTEETPEQPVEEATQQPADLGSEAPIVNAAALQIRLDQFLQLCGVPTGGQAKLLIQGGEVTVNGEVETRRRKKLKVGDEVGLDGEVYDVAFEAESDEAVAEDESKSEEETHSEEE